jgi:RES domain
VLYRRFPMIPGAAPDEPGGPLFVPRFDQGEGRHDNPDVYGALYVSRDPVSPVAELLKDMPLGALPPSLLEHEGHAYALVALDDASLEDVLDLDDPRTLVARDLRPSRVATGERTVTQRMALEVYQEGAVGISWWSTIEASWINVTLFAERASRRLPLAGEPETLTPDHPAVREAAEAVGVILE